VFVQFVPECGQDEGKFLGQLRRTEGALRRFNMVRQGLISCILK